VEFDLLIGGEGVSHIPISERWVWKDKHAIFGVVMKIRRGEERGKVSCNGAIMISEIIKG
jgi:hypothetical protein